MSDREYWAQKKGQLALDNEAAAQGKPPTKFETDKEKLRQEIRAVLAVAVSVEDFAQRLLQRGITVKESRGRLSYLTPDRAKPITARKLGDDFDRAAVGAVLERNAARPNRETKPTKFSVQEQLRQPKGVQRMVDIEAKKAQGKGVGYEHWAKTFNLKQAAQALNIYTEYGFSSPEELDAAITAAFAEMHASADKLKPIETALKEKKELRRQIAIYWATKPVREGLAAQKTKRPKPLTGRSMRQTCSVPKPPFISLRPTASANFHRARSRRRRLRNCCPRRTPGTPNTRRRSGEPTGC